MRHWITFVLILAMSALAADVRPFFFGSPVGTDSASQQNEFDYLLKYKLFGRDYLQMGRRVIIPDKSGWNGSANNITSAEQISLGGTTLAGGSISLGDACQLTTGPIRAQSLSAGNDNNAHLFAGTVCLANTNVSSAVQTGINRAGGTLTGTCPDLPEPPVNLSIPTISWPSTGYQPDILIDDNYGTAYIDIPDGTDTYDVYFDKIHLNRETENGSGKEGAKLYIRMQDGGRLTRIFVHDLQIGNHTSINVIYRTDEGDVIQTQKQYRGNVMFYSDHNITFVNTDNVPIQGTFMTDKKISLKCNLDFAGQLLANELYIGDDFKGENFKFVPFDPDTLDIDPELNKDGGLRENDSTVIIPIRLSDTATVDVYFNYCFDLRDGVTVDDFNLVTDFPICGTATKTVMIPTGEKVPTDPIKVNVKKDTITEPNDYLVMKISIESGAVLPNNKTDGELKIKIIDADNGKKLGFDTTAVYSEYENYTGDVATIKVVNASSDARFTLDSAYEGRYTIDPVTGMITLVTPVDYETTQIDTIKVTVKDTANTSITGYIPITVADVNEAPKITTATIAISENLPVPSKVGAVEWSDEDIRTVFRDNVIEGIAVPDGVTVSPDGSVYTTKVFDFEKDPTELEMTVKVYDRNDPALYDIATVKLTLTNIDESPSVKDTSFTIPENSVGEVGTLAASDPEGNGLTYTIVEENSGLSIDENGKITNTTPFDYETDKVKVIHVAVSDGVLTSTAEVTINISNVNEPVHTADTSFSVDEGKTGPIGKVDSYDEDKTPVKYSVSDTATYSIDSTGTLSVKIPFDFGDTKADTVLVFVTDGEFFDTATVIVKVNNVNEIPELQPNDSLIVPENCKNCTVGVVTATDGDGDPLTYEIDDPRFTIDSTGKIVTVVPFDYEELAEVVVKVTVSDPQGAKDSMDYTINISNVNEPLTVKDTAFTVEENYIGPIGTVDAHDSDKTNPKFTISDTTRYSIDSTGKISIKVPFDYETAKSDTITVIATDGEFSDTARIIINVKDVEEPSTAKIIEVNDTTLVDREIYTNDKNPKITYLGDMLTIDTIATLNPGKNNVKVCYQGKDSDRPGCDSITVWFSDASPVVSISKKDDGKTGIDGITIVEEAPDERIYVNTKLNDLVITVKDTVAKTEKKFDLTVSLDTIKVPSSAYKDMNLILDEDKANLVNEWNGVYRLGETVVSGKDTITLSCLADSKGKRLDSDQTVSYVTKVSGKDVKITYKTDDTGIKVGDTEVSYSTTDESGNPLEVAYMVDEDGKVTKNAEGNIGYTITYTYKDAYGNIGKASIDIVLDQIKPKVEIVSPYEYDSFSTSAVKVEWLVDGVVQDTLTLQRLEDGVNRIIRTYRDKAGNETSDTVLVFQKAAKAIEISLVHPVTEVDQDKVDSLYATGFKYDPKNPYKVNVLDPDTDEKPDVVGIGLIVSVALPSITPTGGVATVDDMLQTVNGNRGILVDKKGNLKAGTSTGADGAYTISTDDYIKHHCTDDFAKDVRKYGIENVPVWNVDYTMKLWIFNTTASYVNDFTVKYTLGQADEANGAGIVQLVVDLVADRDGHVKAFNGKGLGTGAYVTKLTGTSISSLRCDLPEQTIGTILKKKETTNKVFGYKRPSEE